MSQLASIMGRGAERSPRGSEWRKDRLGAGRLERLLISAFVVITLAAIVVANLPDSKVKGALFASAGPYLTAAGLDQSWGMFAPDGRRSVLVLVATVRYSDGSTAAWRLPEGGPALAAYWDYRWRKWAENLMTSDGDSSGLQRPAAMWIARQMQRSGKRVALVTLATRWADLPPPGQGGGRHGPWHEDVFYRLSFR